ncbi:uncharacterized protein LOC111713318 isoform X1 [Eurytemora carolleeae]|uniref:uncharacterized protein LOC111713318 isoform X1 n=1 Tax=Eurytemora carolleeae TaxID=1294199 RepID=UPI000C7955F1|nr:uncharacterized protein LOC111713318 isoform X1 [Eurytemora carolleeae]|eukprot:XP_023343923.1 uncharacterized protein LOC111713318 isoform X1 [Eurytemora affinis]
MLKRLLLLPMVVLHYLPVLLLLHLSQCQVQCRSSQYTYRSFNTFNGGNTELNAVQHPIYISRIMSSLSGNQFTGPGSNIIYAGPTVIMSRRRGEGFRSPGLSPHFHGDTMMCFIPNQQQMLIPCSAVRG